MAQRVMTTGGYPVKLPDADEIASDITGDVMGRKVSINQLTGMSDAVSDVIHAKTPKDIRDAAGIQESQIAVKGDTGPAGLSAYEQAVSDGLFDGTFEEFLASLEGDKGEQGDPGETGPKGDTGPQGQQGLPGTNATPTLFEIVESKVITAGTKVAIKFTKSFTTPPIVQPYPIWNGTQMVIGQASEVTITGCNVTVMQSRGTLLLTSGPFEVATAGVTFRMFVIGN